MQSVIDRTQKSLEKMLEAMDAQGTVRPAEKPELYTEKGMKAFLKEAPHKPAYALWATLSTISQIYSGIAANEKVSEDKKKYEAYAEALYVCYSELTKVINDKHLTADRLFYELAHHFHTYVNACTEKPFFTGAIEQMRCVFPFVLRLPAKALSNDILYTKTMEGLSGMAATVVENYNAREMANAQQQVAGCLSSMVGLTKRLEACQSENQLSHIKASFEQAKQAYTAPHLFYRIERSKLEIFDVKAVLDEKLNEFSRKIEAKEAELNAKKETKTKEAKALRSSVAAEQGDASLSVLRREFQRLESVEQEIQVQIAEIQLCEVPELVSIQPEVTAEVPQLSDEQQAQKASYEALKEKMNQASTNDEIIPFRVLAPSIKGKKGEEKRINETQRKQFYVALGMDKDKKLKKEWLEMKELQDKYLGKGVLKMNKKEKEKAQSKLEAFKTKLLEVVEEKSNAIQPVVSSSPSVAPVPTDNSAEREAFMSENQQSEQRRETLQQQLLETQRKKAQLQERMTELEKMPADSLALLDDKISVEGSSPDLTSSDLSDELEDISSGSESSQQFINQEVVDAILEKGKKYCEERHKNYRVRDFFGKIFGENSTRRQRENFVNKDLRTVLEKAVRESDVKESLALLASKKGLFKSRTSNPNSKRYEKTMAKFLDDAEKMLKQYS